MNIENSQKIDEFSCRKQIAIQFATEPTGLNRHLGNSLSTRDIHEEVWTIADDDPLSATAWIEWTSVTEREGWRARTHTVSTLSCTAPEWLIAERIEAFHDDRSLFARERQAHIRRDHM